MATAGVTALAWWELSSTLAPPWLGLCHIDTSKNTKAWAVSHHTDTSKNTQAWAVSQHTDTSKNTKAWAVSQHTDTSKNTKAWAVSQHSDTSKNTKAWAQSQHTDASKNTKAWAVSQYIVMQGLSSVTIKSLHNSIHPPEMEINSLKMVCGCLKMVTHAIFSSYGMHLSVYNCMYWVTLHPHLTPQCSAGEHTTLTLALSQTPFLRTLQIISVCFLQS